MRFLFISLGSIALLTACAPQATTTPHHVAATDPCTLPRLDGGDHLVASLYAYEGMGKPTLKPWSKNGNRHGAVAVEPPADGFPRDMDVILVLNGYEPIEWRIAPELAKKTDAVLVAGYHEPRVTGLPETVPVVTASYEARADEKRECAALQPLYADNEDDPRHRTTAKVVEAMTGLGLDRIAEVYDTDALAIPSSAAPYRLKKNR